MGQMALVLNFESMAVRCAVFQAGAEKVYAVEASGMAKFAKQLAASQPGMTVLGAGWAMKS